MPGLVTVACKIPNGLKIRLYRMEDHDEPQFGGGFKSVKRAVLDRTVTTLNGPAKYKGRDMTHPIVNGAGLTHNVDADAWAEWMKQNRDADYVRNGAVFAQSSKPGEVQAQAKDWDTRRSGFEPVNPYDLPPEFRNKVTPADAPK